MTGAFEVTLSGKSIYISSPAGLLPKSATWIRSPWTVAKRQSPEKTRDIENGSMVTAVTLDICCRGNKKILVFGFLEHEHWRGYVFEVL